MYSLTERFKDVLQGRGLLNPGNSFLLAVSGGMDSVVLCHLAFLSRLKFVIAHCNFLLRGEESLRDENFVNTLGTRYGVDVLVRKFETAEYARLHKYSIQEAARNLRYEWFDQLVKEKNFTATLLAHHANDNIETMLMNFFRGTGLEGLTGIKEKTFLGKGFRPMLSFMRSEVEAFAHEHQLKWVEDSSNQASAYTRNFFRNEIIPAVSRVFPQAEQNLIENLNRFRHINDFYQASILQTINNLIEKHENETRVPVKKLIQLNSPAIIYELFKPFGFREKQVHEIQKLCMATSGKFIENERFQVIRHGNWLLITGKSRTSHAVAIEKGVSEIPFADKALHVSMKEINGFKMDHTESVAQLDAGKIEYPLLLRKWEQGDYFYPLGMRKKKKLSRFFIDQKLPRHLKESVWILESNKKIIWVVGMRIDDRFKITPATQQVLLLSLSSP